jgi:hypothetical protein
MGIRAYALAAVVPGEAVAFVFGGGRATRLPAAIGARGRRRPGRWCAGFGAGTAPDEKKARGIWGIFNWRRVYIGSGRL